MLRLIGRLFRLVRWCIYAALVIIGSKELLALGLLVGCFLTIEGTWTPADLGRNLMIGFAVACACHLAAAVLRPRAGRAGVRSLPVPIVGDLSKPADRPTVRQALGRLDPALRRIIETPPPEASGA